MTKSTITRERLEQLADNNTICKVSWDERIELAQIALSAMDCEPVAWAWHYREQWHVTNDERRAEFVAKDGDVAVLPLYRHAQPAQISEPVLPLQDKDLQGVIDALEHPAGINAAGKQVVRHALVELQERRKADREPVAEVVSIYGDPEAFGEREIRPLVGIQQMPYGTKLYRHAQPAPVVPEEATPDSIEILASARRRDHAVFQWDEDQRNAAADSWNAFRAAMLQELKKSAGTEAICRSDENVQVLHTKSPAQSDCCPAQNVVVPAQSPIVHGYLPECECAGCKATARICTEMAVNSLVIPDEMTSGQAYEIGYYYGDPVDVFARGANWMRQHIIDSTLAAAPQAAPGVPKEMTAGIAVKHWEGGRGSIESFIAGYNFCRAAILAAAPQEVKGE